MSAAKRRGRGLSGADLMRLAAERAAARAQAEGLDETVRLARQKGECVERVEGRVRITSRDGLQSLYESGGLQRCDYEAGLLYRQCYEALEKGPRSNLDRDFVSGVRGSAGAGDGGFAELRALKLERLSRWEALASAKRQLWVLRLVAGQGRTLNSIAPGGSARLANRRALAQILGEIARERGLRR